jgi:hypothetical protein
MVVVGIVLLRSRAWEVTVGMVQYLTILRS